jgi:hypothetical protein
MEYDVNGFLIRRLVRSDFAVQSIAQYSVRGDTLVQSWRELKSHDWKLRGDTSTVGRLEVNLFVFNKEGKITHEFSDRHGLVIYIYSKGKLVSKEIEIRRNNEEKFHVEKIAEFKYDKGGQIAQINFNSVNREKHFFFSAGLLDSCHVAGHHGSESWIERYKCRYVYY